MEEIKCSEFKPGRHFMGKMPHGKCILKSIENFCIEKKINMATFSLIGAVSCAHIGFYDQNKREYLKHQKNEEFEILKCSGNISLKDDKPFVHAHIILADKNDNAIGGHLFYDTIIFAGEIFIQELIGKPCSRTYDNITGLYLWR